MKEPLLSLAPSDIGALSIAIETGRLCPPYPPSSVERIIKTDVAVKVAAAIHDLEACGMSPVAIARSLDLLALGLTFRPPVKDLIDLVTTGPQVGGVTNRDTAVVVRDLFRRAEQSVLIAGYAIHQGQRVFKTLADRMLERPSLKVQMFLDIKRKTGDTSASSEILGDLFHRFRTTQRRSMRSVSLLTTLKCSCPRPVSLKPRNRRISKLADA